MDWVQFWPGLAWSGQTEQEKAGPAGEEQIAAMRVVKPSFQREGASSASAGPPEPEELASASSLCPVPAAAASEAQEEALLAHHGRTFHFAARFLPGELRPSFVTLYAFFRTLDDLVDERGPEEEPRAIAEELRAWRAWFLADHQGPAPREPLGSRLTQVVERYGVPGTLFLDFLEGLHWDLWPREFASFSRLRAYCYRVAGTVGLALAHVLGATSEGALAAAEGLGIAMQLTNILRDVGGDLRKGRLYLPLEDLTRFGLSRSHLQQLLDTGQGPDAAFRDLMRYEVARTHLCYAQSLPGVWLLPPDRRLPILLAGRLYRRILHAIEQHNYDVLRARAHTTLTEKLREAMLALTLDRLWRRGEQLGAFGLEVSLGDEP